MLLVLQGHEFRNAIQAALPVVEQSVAAVIEVDTSARAMRTMKWASVAAGGGLLSWAGQFVARSFF